MPQKKTKFLHFSGLQLRYIEQFKLILKRMRRFPVRGLAEGSLPADVQKALTIFFFGLDTSNLLLDPSPAAQEQRLELTKLMLEYPEFTVAAIYSFYVQKPKPETNRSALVRMFLLTEPFVVLPNGRHVSPVGATDGEIAMAVQKKYGLKDVPKNLVKKIRQELERLCGEPVASYIQALQKSTEGIDLMVPKKDPAKAAKDRHEAKKSGLYQPH
jgi:hypothetical protein